MKITCYIGLMLCFSIVCKAQDNNWEKVSDSLAMISRAKADEVFTYFDTIRASKLLYSLEDRYFYLIINDTPCYKEYYIILDSSAKVNIHPIDTREENKKQRKQQKRYHKLLAEAEPFNLSKYHTNYITNIPDAKFVRGKPSYFVVKNINGKRYGEYSLAAFTLPLPIDGKLAGYLMKRLSDEIIKYNKAAH